LIKLATMSVPDQPILIADPEEPSHGWVIHHRYGGYGIGEGEVEVARSP
jgi:hypothetical protein